ncbi:MAG: oligosaccharide flippase family protein [Ignavibacteriales bacterium]|nr:oligosaccharide flippase family protein [Ignavibacteriales bacterium]
MGFINTLWLYPQALTEEQIGLTRTLVNAAFLFGTFAALGSANMPARFFPYFNNRTRKHHGFLFFLLLVGTAGYLFFLAVFFLAKDWVYGTYITAAPMLISYLYYLLPFTGFVLFWAIFEAYAIIQQMPVVPNFLRETFIRGVFTLGLVLVLCKAIGFHTFITMVVSAYGFILFAIILYIRRAGLLFLAPQREIFADPKMKEMLIFGGFLLMGNVSGAIIANIDGLMLSAYSGLKATGIYSIAFFIGTIVEIPKRSLSQVLVPLISEANKKNDLAMLSSLYKKSSINQLIVGGFIFLVIWCNIENIFALIPHGNVFVQGKWVVFYIGLARLFDMLTGINAEIIGTSKYYRYDLIFYVLLGVIGIAANAVLIPMLGMTGAAVAAAISIFLFNTMRYVFIYVKYGMQPLSIGTIKMLLVGTGIIFLSGAVTSGLSAIPDIIARSGVISIVFISAVYGFRVSEDVMDVTKKVLVLLKERMSGHS